MEHASYVLQRLLSSGVDPKYPRVEKSREELWNRGMLREGSREKCKKKKSRKMDEKIMKF